MTCTRRLTGLTAALACLFLSAAANAAPLVLTVDSTQSTLSLSISAIGGSATAATSITIKSGQVSGDLGAAFTGPGSTMAPGDLELTSGSFNVEEFGFLLGLGFLGTVTYTFRDGLVVNNDPLGGDISAPPGPLPQTLAAIDLGEYDSTGMTFAINRGEIFLQSSGGIGIIDPFLDLGVVPLVVTLSPASGPLTILQDSAGPGPVPTTLIIPIAETTTIATDPIDVSLTLAGQLVATGFLLIPEPGTLLLLAAGILGLAPLVSRRRFP